MLSYYGNSHLYTTLEVQRVALYPVNRLAKAGKEFFGSNYNPASYTDYGRHFAASCEMLERITRNFCKPEFGIESTIVDDKKVSISEKIILEKTFGNLIHFRKYNAKNFNQKKLLIVAPMSGHYATLLRGTVEGFLPHFDVYITDWVNAQEVPVYEGIFDADDYINYIIEFIQHLGEDVHVIGVCQPAVPVLAAVSIMSSENDPLVPKSMTLIGGPIDTRKNPTEVNKLAKDKPLDWFKQSVISRVPMNYPGFMRPVYPGFLQLGGFMSMNLDKHIEAHTEFFNHLIEGDGESVDAHKKFYNEYLSVMDITAEFYLQTVENVFQKHSLPKGKMVSRGRAVTPSDIKKTALLAVEGERDDISGRGQTEAAIDICTSIPKSKKKYYLQKSVGHYGLFNGRRFREYIVPVIKEFIEKA